MLITTTTPPIIPRVGETYLPEAEDPDPGDICVPWNVIDVQHTVWLEQGQTVFEAIVFLERDAKDVADAAQKNAEQRAKKAGTRRRRKPASNPQATDKPR